MRPQPPGTLTVFRVDGSHLELSDQIPTEGSEPDSVAEHAGLVYVLNLAGTSASMVSPVC